MAKDKAGVDWRGFLAGVGAAGAASIALTGEAQAKPGAPPPPPTALPVQSAARLTQIAAMEEAPPSNAAGDAGHVVNPGSDYMVGVLRELGYDYVAATPGTTFRGLQESVINYAGNAKPEWITAVHEEISGAMAHGYAKVTGKPMAIMVHNTVGLQHATMAIYNCFADRVPMLVMLGNYADGALRVTGADWDHSAIDDAAMVRGYIKWDDQPGSLEHFIESMQRGQGLMMTAPQGPIVVVCDQTLQENPASIKPQAMLPKYVPPRHPIADPDALKQIAKMLAGAQNPVIVADRSVRSQADVDTLVKIAEALEVPVIDKLGRMNFPTSHHLYGAPAMANTADVILALDPGDLFGIVNELPDTVARVTRRKIRADANVITIDSQLLVGAANYQDKQRFYQADLPVPGDSAATLPYLLDAINSALTADRRSQNAQRGSRLRDAYRARRAADIEAAAIAWDAVPISVARLITELGNQIKGLDWALVSQSNFQLGWQQRLWDFNKFHQYIGGSGAAGIGYLGGATVGAALGFKGTGVLPISVQGDGDFMMGPGAMWTAAHHRIPLLTIIHNNRAWHQETMSVQILASRRNRHPENGRIGTVITDPNINYAKVADGFGVYSEGPIEHPNDLGPAIARAIKVVQSGHPALVDCVTQPR